MTLKWSSQYNAPSQGHLVYTIDTTTGGTTPANVDFNLRTTGAVDYTVVWEDYVSEDSTSNTLLHSYGSAGTYDVQVFPTGTYRPYFNNVIADVDQITKVSIGGAVDLGTSLSNAWYGADRMTEFECNFNATSNVTSFIRTWANCISLTSFPLLDTSSGTNFYDAWYNCNSLTSFPLLNTSNATNFSGAWKTCSSLTSFPLLNTSSGTSFASAWYNCNSLTSFPLLDTSGGTSFSSAWYNCNSLTSFPLLDTSSGTSFYDAWAGCSSLTSFPANFFDSWTGTPVNGCFVNTWDGCSSLTATSVENILNSIDTSGQSAPASGVDITIDYNAGSGTPNVSTAVTNLKSRGWTITLNGVLQ